MQPTKQKQTQDDELLELFDYAYMRDLLGFFVGAPRRRRAIAAGALGLGLLLTGATVAYWPRTYSTQARIFAQRNVIIPLLSNPRRPVPNSFDAPTQGVREIILSQDSLVQIVRDTRLVELWSQQRPPLLRAKDRVMTAIFGAGTDEDLERALVGTLEKKLTVTLNDATIRIAVEWRNPQMAHDIVKAAQDNFLSGRSALDVMAIQESLAILDGTADTQSKVVAAALADVQVRTQALSDAAAAAAASASVMAAPPAQRFGAPGAPALAPTASRRPATWSALVGRPSSLSASSKAAALLEEKRRAIRELDEPRQRRLAQLRVELADLSVTYAPAHPLIVETEAKIREASVDPPEIAALKQEEAQLLMDLQSAAGDARRSPYSAAPSTESPGAAGAPAQPLPYEDFLFREDPPELASAKVKLASAIRKYEDIRDRIDMAQLELHTSQAAFKYRYTIVTPAEVPSKPDGASSFVFAAIGAFLSVVFAILAAAARDILRGRFVEAWQVRRKLRIPLLASVHHP